MKYLITFPALIFVTSFCFAQTQQKDSVDYYISHLDWDAATVATTYVPKVVLNEYAQKLVMINDRSIDNRLYEKIGDTEKILAIHVILTQRHHYPANFWYSENRQNTDSITKYRIDHYTKDTLMGMFYHYNGLQWYYDFITGQPSIRNKAVKYAQSYWRKKIKKKKK
jgi:hypothetical protein